MHHGGLDVQDGRLSVLRLEQLLREKITTNTTFQVKTATGGIGGGGGAISGPQQLEREVEVTHSPASRRNGTEWGLHVVATCAEGHLRESTFIR